MKMETIVEYKYEQIFLSQLGEGFASGGASGERISSGGVGGVQSNFVGGNGL